MSSINVAVISGNLTKDCEERTTAGGMSVVTFSVAVNERRKNQRGEWEDVASFIDCTIFGNRAHALAPYLTKGTKVMVSGKLRQSSWEAKDGSKRSRVELIADEIELAGQKQERRQERQADLYADDCPF